MDYEYSNLPLGLAMAGLLDERPRTEESKTLTEAEKEAILFRYRDAEKQKEREQIRNSVPLEDNMNDLFDGPGIG